MGDPRRANIQGREVLGFSNLALSNPDRLESPMVTVEVNLKGSGLQKESSTLL